MRVHNKLAVSLIFAIAILILSMFAEFVPCQTAPVIPNAQFQWKLCTQSPDSPTLGIQTKYFGYTSSLTESYLITMFLAFVLALIILSLLTKSKKGGK